MTSPSPQSPRSDPRPPGKSPRPPEAGPCPGRPDRPAPPVSVRAVLTTPVGHLALAMLVVELLAGMQTYLNQTVLPLLAVDLGARDRYGLVTAAGTVPAFLTMPLGGAILAQLRR